MRAQSCPLSVVVASLKLPIAKLVTTITDIRTKGVMRGLDAIVEQINLHPRIWNIVSEAPSLMVSINKRTFFLGTTAAT